MAKQFSILRERMEPEARAKAKAMAQQYKKEMPLDELREARRLTQQSLGELLGIKQSAVSRMERRTDMYVSTLAAMVRAMGGKLTIQATFPDVNGRIEINTFEGVAKPKHRTEARHRDAQARAVS